ncbi:MAG: SLC13 family permease [Anderseniella sp.]|jgi:di/tricarboxylate transporter|nr:SLC13 family permease [Anderseniella sp.]
MTIEQMIVFSIIAAAMAMFLWGRIRYDVVAIMALLAGVYAGVVPAMSAFTGFAHPAVVTVAAVLIISRALQNSGLVDQLARMLSPTRRTTTLQVAATSALGALLSSFMNNVGALALMLPVTLRNAVKARRSPSLVLMPLSFATLLGGMVTLIGTPPNIVISTFRQDLMGEPFAMFDFAPAGLAACAGGILYLSFIGWRLLPERIAPRKAAALTGVERYSFETGLPEGSPLVGTRVAELEAACENEITVLAIIRNGMRRLAPAGSERFRPGDMLIVEGDPVVINPLADGRRLMKLGTPEAGNDRLRSDDVQIVEAVVMPDSALEGRNMRGVRMHARYGVNLLAVSREGKSPIARLKNIRFRTGDVLLMQGEAEQMEVALKSLGCMVLASRGLQPLRGGTRAWLPAMIFAIAIAVAAFGLVPVPIAFVSACLALVLTSCISVNEIYTGIEWPVLILLGAMIPIGQALEATGGTGLIAGAIIDAAGGLPVWAVLGVLMLSSMWISDIIPNATTAILMAPIGARVAAGLEANPDAFLMAVAVGAAAPFLTPIGHQSNTLVMGPGGYHFTDYARMGLIMELLVVVLATPAIWFWWMT